MDTEKIISEVNSSMTIEGMPLTEEDKNRIRYCIENPDQASKTLKQLIAKHKKPIEATQDD